MDLHVIKRTWTIHGENDWTRVPTDVTCKAMGRERDLNMVIRVNTEERARLHALADAGEEPIAAMIRRWVRERYVARFGDAPPPRPKLRRAPARSK